MSVPEAWTRLNANLHDALTARASMKLITGEAHDEEMRRYVRATDLIVDDLAALKSAHVLGQITMVLAKKERV